MPILVLTGAGIQINQWDIPGTGPQPWEADWMSFGNYGPYGNLPYAHVITIPSVAIPKNSRILSAVLQYASTGNFSGDSCNVNLYFTNATNPTHPSGRIAAEALPLTSPVAWNALSAWTTSTVYTAPDLKNILQTIIDKNGWESGNNLQIVCRDNASTNAAYRAARYNTGVVLIVTYKPTTPETVPGAVVEQDIESNTTGQLFMQFGTPTITLSSARLQITEHDGLGEVSASILDDDFEILIGAK